MDGLRSLVIYSDHQADAAARFKERCLALLDEVDPEGIVITKRGKPVAKLIPFATDPGHSSGH